MLFTSSNPEKMFRIRISGVFLAHQLYLTTRRAVQDQQCRASGLQDRKAQLGPQVYQGTRFIIKKICKILCTFSSFRHELM